MIPLATDLRARPCDLFTRDMAQPPGRASEARAVLAGAHSPCPRDPGVRIPLAAARSVNTRCPPPPRRGGAALSADLHFCASCHAPKERRGEQRGGRRGSDSPKWPAACARRGGQPRRPAGSRPRPLTCRGRSEDSHHRHLLDRGLGEGGLADIQPLQRAGHVVVGSHYPH